MTEKRLKQLLSKHRIRRWTAEKVGEILSAPPLPLVVGSVEAISEHALLLLPQLRLLDLQRKQVAQRTQQLLDHMAASTADFPESQEHRDIPVLLSLSGVGRIITATMLAEGAHSLSLRDYHALRAHAGIAPVTRQSGKSRQVLMRYRCNRRLRNAFYHWARTSIQHDPRSKQHYARLRQVGHNHGRALRGVADRLLAVLIAMLKTGKTYDPIDVPSPTLWPSERDLSMPLPPDVRPSICLAHPVAAGKGTTLPPHVDKWWGVRFSGTTKTNWDCRWQDYFPLADHPDIAHEKRVFLST
jgi:Transposase IS116/IS110/IS902 family